jgi:ParB family chromosome partitioning protein
MSKVQKPRLGRGLRSLIPGGHLPVEVELPSPAPAPPVESISRLELENPPIDPEAGNGAGRVSDAGVEVTSAAGQPLMLSPDSVYPNPHQPRQSMDEAKVAELAASIKSTGLIQPIVVRKTGDEVYQLIAGERRLRAAKLAGLTAIPAILREASSYEQAQMALVENIQREDLNPIERASSYRALMDQLGLTQAELANRLGEDRSSIANHLRLLELNENVRELVRVGKLSLGHAKLLAGVNDPIEQERLANLVLGQDLSVRNLERLLAEPQAPATAPRRAAAPSAHLQDLERSLSRQLGLRVHVRAGGKKGRGRVVIHYSDLDQFDALMTKLGVQVDET